MRFPSELQNAKRVIRAWVRAHFSDQKLANVAAFNADGKMTFQDPCGCLLGVTNSERLHRNQDCDQQHYRRAQRLDAEQTSRWRKYFKYSALGETERAYLILGFSPAFDNCMGHDDVRRRRFSALLRAEMRRRDRLILSGVDRETAPSLQVVMPSAFR